MFTRTDKHSCLSLLLGSILFLVSFGFLSWSFDWGRSITYTPKGVAGFTIGLMILPFAVMRITYGLTNISAISALNPTKMIIPILATFASFCFILSVVMFVQWDGYYYLAWNKSSSITAMRLLFSLTCCFFLAYFVLICSILSYAVWSQRKNRFAKLGDKSDGSASEKSMSEGTPLLGIGANELQKAESSKGAGIIVVSDSNGDSAGQPIQFEYVRTTYLNDMRCSPRDWGVFSFLIVALPALFVLTCVLPDNLNMFTPFWISHWTKVTSHLPSNSVVDITFSSGVQLHVFVDVLFYYLLVLFACTGGYLARKSLWFRIEMRRLRQLGGSSIITQGEWVLWCVFVPFASVGFLYWLLVFDYTDMRHGYDYQWLQRAGRATGRLTTLLLAFSLFPVSRNSIWVVTLGLSVEHLMPFHRIFAYSFVVSSLIHVIIWIAFLAANGCLWENFIFSSLPLALNRTDISLPTIYYVYLFVTIPAFTIGVIYKIRQSAYEWFYAIHMFAAFVTIAGVLWHANGGWYFLLPPMLLFSYDKIMRVYYSNRAAKLRWLSVIDKCDIVEMTTEFTSDEPLQFGQYFWMNIKDISASEWHPYFISNFDNQSKLCSFLIRRGLDGSWSDKLHEKATQGRAVIRQSDLRLEGPYGSPLVVDAYRKILIIAGGIGIAPVINFFSSMLQKAVRDETQVSVDLVWITKHPRIFLKFKETLLLYTQHFDNDPERLFDIRLFYTSSQTNSQISNIESQIGNLSLEKGRPNLMAELSYIEQLGSFTLIVSSGPQTLVDECKRTALRFGAHFRAETFTL